MDDFLFSDLVQPPVLANDEGEAKPANDSAKTQEDKGRTPAKNREDEGRTLVKPAQARSHGSKVPSPLLAAPVKGRKKNEAASMIQKAFRGRSSAGSAFRNVDSNRDDVLSRPEFKKAISTGTLSINDKQATNGMTAKLHALEEEATRLRKMLAEVSPKNDRLSLVPKLNLSGLNGAPKQREAESLRPASTLTTEPCVEPNRTSPGNKPLRPVSAPKLHISQQVTMASRGAGSMIQGSDEAALRQWLMKHVDCQEKREELLKQFQQWANPDRSSSEKKTSTSRTRGRLPGRSKSSSPPRKTNSPRNASPLRKTSPRMNTRARSPEMSKLPQNHSPHRSQSIEPQRSQDAQKKRAVPRSQSADQQPKSDRSLVGSKARAEAHIPPSKTTTLDFAGFESMNHDKTARTPQAQAEVRRRQEQLLQEIEHGHDDRREGSESVERWTRWQKPHERETFELVAELGVEDIGIILDVLPDGQAIVNEVLFGSWAWRKGVERGDELVEVEDKKVSEISEAQMRWAMLRRPVRLAFSTNDASKYDLRSRSGSPDGKGKGKGKKKKGVEGAIGTGRSKEEHEEHQMLREAEWGTDTARRIPRNLNKVFIGRANRDDGNEIVHVTPDDCIRFAHSPLTSALVSSFKITNVSKGRVAFKVKTSAPKSYHIIKPSTGVLNATQNREIRAVFKPRGFVEFLQPEYCVVIQATALKEEEEGHDKFEKLARNGVQDIANVPDMVQEHRLLVIFEDADRWKPVDLRGTGLVKHVDSSFVCPSRMHAAHDDRMAKLADKRTQSRQQKIQEFESASAEFRQKLQWIPTAPISKIEESIGRLHGEAAKKYERRSDLGKQMVGKEMKSIETKYNSGPKKPLEATNEHFAKMVREFQNQRQGWADRQDKEEKEELRQIAEKSVHAKAHIEAGQEHGTDRMYQEALDRRARKEKRIEQDHASKEAATHNTIANAETVNIDELLEKLLKGGIEHKSRMDKLQREADEAARLKANMGLPDASAGRQTQALRHAHTLSGTWRRHERFKVLLQDRFVEAERTLLKRQAVHPMQAPIGWIEHGLDDMIQRLFPEHELLHPYNPAKRTGGVKIAFGRRSLSPLPPWKGGSSVARSRRSRSFEGNDMTLSESGLDESDQSSQGEAIAEVNAIEDPLIMGKLVDEGIQRVAKNTTARKAPAATVPLPARLFPTSPTAGQGAGVPPTSPPAASVPSIELPLDEIDWTAWQTDDQGMFGHHRMSHRMSPREGEATPTKGTQPSTPSKSWHKHTKKNANLASPSHASSSRPFSPLAGATANSRPRPASLFSQRSYARSTLSTTDGEEERRRVAAAIKIQKRQRGLKAREEVKRRKAEKSGQPWVPAKNVSPSSSSCLQSHRGNSGTRQIH